MIMDASSIIVEYASQKIRYGIPVKEAYLEATQKMFIPALISTCTVLIVSAPLLAFPGVIGGFMKYLPLTLIIVLISSLFVALFIMPALGGIFDKPIPKEKQDIVIEDLSTKEMTQLSGLQGIYAKIVNKTLQKPITSMVGLITLIVTIIFLYAKFNRGVEFFPNIETDYIRGFIRGTGNLSLEEKTQVMEEVGAKVQKQIGKEVDIFYTFAGGTGGNAENIPKDTIGVIDIQLVDWSIRRKAKEIIQELQENITQSGFIVTFDKQKDGPPQTTDIYYEIFAESPEKIYEGVQAMKEYLTLQPTLQNVEDTRPPERIEYQVLVNKQLAMQYDIDASVIAGYVKLATNGVLIDKYTANYLNEKSEILLRYPNQSRNISNIMNSFLVKNGKSIPISNFIQITKSPELVEVVRKNTQPMITVKANVKESYTNENGEIIKIVKSAEKERILNDLEKIAEKYDTELFAGGTDEDQKETMTFLKNAFLIALITIFLIFLMEFNSFGYAIIIISSVFLSIIGVLLGLVISQNPLSIVMCGIGIIALAGIVVSNNLIYLDFFQTFKSDIKHENDASIKEALIKAALLRAKPILLTSATNVVGLLPAMFGIGISFETGVLTLNSPTSQWWIQLSSAIAGGLTFSTILTLFFTPSKVLLYLRFRGYAKKNINSIRNFIYSKLFKQNK
jgi:multidrug efflux pump